MARYIDADKLLEVLKERRAYNSPKLSKLANEAISCGLSFAMQEVRNQPTADVVEIKHGHWVKVGKTKGGSNILQCSECGNVRKGVGKSTYCRDCGAKMDGRSDT